MYKENSYASILLVGFILIGSVAVVVGGSRNVPQIFNQRNVWQTDSNASVSKNCEQIRRGYWNCTDEATKEKAKLVNKWFTNYEIIKAHVTAYTPHETCKDGRIENCIDASGKRPIYNLSIACPRSIPLGSLVNIEQHWYTCSDRTALRLNGRFDIFMRDKQTALRFGKQIKQVTIQYEKPQTRDE